MRSSPSPSRTSARTSPSAIALAALAFLALAPFPTQADAPATLRVSELLPVPDGAQGQREFVELWNPTDHAVDLAGWKLRDAATASGSTNEYTFQAGRLAPNGRIVVWSNGSADARGPSWSTSASKTVWNDAGDAVTVLDPEGDVADWLAYGNSAAVPPAGFEGGAKPSAPARGLSVALADGSWSAGAPTPALAPGTVGGMAAAVVVNVAPDAKLLGAPSSTKPGQTLSVEPVVEDANGAGDVAEWTLKAGGATVASGTGAPSGKVALVAPAFSGPWTLELTAADAGGLLDVASATVQVRDARLSVTVPGGLLRFPDLRPGDGAVAATDWATIRNDGTDAATPLLDVSPFAGSAGEIPVEGNLQVGVQPDGGNVTWTDYRGPLTPLPDVAPGKTLRLSLRLQAVPAPLAAGSYGTTFAVVAA